MLREYVSKPQAILACIITEKGILTKKKSGEYEYKEKGKGASTTLLLFAVPSKQTPEIGDFIMYADKEDVYLCKADLFHAKYNHKGMEIL